jgi:hypothetical protein
MSRLTPIYTIYGLLSATSGLGVHHTAGQIARLLGALLAFSIECLYRLSFGITRK